MSTKLFISIIYLGLLLCCKSEAQSLMQGSIKGTGEIVSEDISLESLKGVNLGFDGDVVLIPGSSQKITLSGQKNVIDNIKREVKNGTWNIVYDKEVRNAKEVAVYVTLPTLEKIGLSGSGSIRTEGKFSSLNDLELQLSGSGDMSLEYDAHKTEVSVSGSGEINLMGSSTSLAIAISGSGNVNAVELVSDNCVVHVSGSGDATVQATKNLESTISGSGNITYSGNATVTTKISGTGEVNKIN
ncbi:MAG: head GIN domain-containing protein [Saprospiraceae bacterium]